MDVKETSCLPSIPTTPPNVSFEAEFHHSSKQSRYDGSSATAGHSYNIQIIYLKHQIPPSCLRLNHDHQPITVATWQRIENIIDRINIPLPYCLVQLHLPPESAEDIRQRRQDLRLG